MLTKILPLIPKHKTYVEAYCGGASLLFAKEISNLEVINDIDVNVVNFFKVMKNEFKELQRMIRETPYSRAIHKNAKDIIMCSTAIPPLQKAWAFWVQTQMSFANIFCGGLGYSLDGRLAANIAHKRDRFTNEYSKRLDKVFIECRSAIDIIKCFDTDETFFYLDPPYFNSSKGHYATYTIEDFTALLSLLKKIKGKFLLSSYPSKILDEYTKQCGWTNIEFSREIAVCHKFAKKKIEVLTRNYVSKRERGLFEIAD